MTYIIIFQPNKNKFDEWVKTLMARLKVKPKRVKIVAAYLMLPCKKDCLILETDSVRALHEFLIPFVPVTSDMDLYVARSWDEVFALREEMGVVEPPSKEALGFTTTFLTEEWKEKVEGYPTDAEQEREKKQSK